MNCFDWKYFQGRVNIISNDFCLATLMNELQMMMAHREEKRRIIKGAEKQKESEEVIGQCHRMHEQKIEWREH